MSTTLINNELKQNQLNHLNSEQVVLGFMRAIEATCAYAYIKNQDGIYLYANNYYQNLFKSTKTGIIGLSDDVLFSHKQFIKNQTSDQRVIEFGEELSFEEEVSFIGDELVHIFWTVKTPIFNTNGKVIGLSGISTDITKLKIKSKFDTIINKTLEEIASGVALSSIFKHLINGLESLFPSTMCSILRISDDGKHLVQGECSSLPIEYNQAIDGLKIAMGAGSCGTAAFTGKRVVVENVREHPYWKPYRKLVKQHNIGACWSEPILSSKGNVLGTFAIYHHISVSPRASDLSIIEQFAHLASIAIERELTNKALQQQENYQRALLDNFPFLVWFKDVNGKFLTVNRPFATACGINNPHELIGKTDFDVWPENLARNYVEDDMQVLLDGNHKNLDELIEVNGQKFWYETYKSPIRLGDKIVGTVGFAREITDRKMNEAEIAKAKALLEAVIENIPVRVFWKDKDLNYLGCNSIFAHDAGLKRSEDIIGKNDYDFAWLAQADMYREDDLKIIESGIPKFNFEETQTTPDGNNIWVRTSKVPLIATDGEVLGVLGLYEDITKQKLAENDLRIAATAFQSQEGIMITDAESKIIKVNQSFTVITGYAFDEVFGKNPSILSSGHHNAEFFRQMWNSLNTLGSWEGEIWNKRKNGEIYPEHLIITAVNNVQGQVTNYVATLTDTSFRNKADREIQYLAFYDSLTGLPNRRLLHDRLNQSLSKNKRTLQRSALLFIDLDHFKLLNDTYGHDNGDILLKLVAERLQANVRVGDTVARLGGDEFVVVLENLGEDDLEVASVADTIASKIVTALNVPYHIGNNDHISTPSVGIVIIDNQESINEILKQADIAMYQAKKAGRNTIRFFSPHMQASINARVNLERELHGALKNQEFVLFYQKQCDALGVPFGAEALIRWNHKTKGLVSPAEFIPLAEETGLNIPIGAWVLETACAQLKEWQSKPSTQHLTLSVNISANHLRQADFHAYVISLVERYDINPNLLKLELTESMLLESIEESINCMNKLGQINISFSLDDFGTGYSSLQYLKRLPIYQLKIDKSFVRDIVSDASDRAIVSTIISMAKTLNLRVIAEGLETIEQREFLIKEGCNEFQGYYFGKPMEISEFEKCLI